MPRSVAWVVRALAVAAAAAALYWLCVMPYRCNRDILAVRASIQRQPAMSPFRASAIADQNAGLLNDACRSCAPNVSLLLVLADNDDFAGRTEDVIRDLDRAIAIQPRPEVFMGRANSELELGRLDAAIADFRMAARFEPSSADVLDPELRARVLNGINAR